MQQCYAVIITKSKSSWDSGKDRKRSKTHAQTALLGKSPKRAPCDSPIKPNLSQEDLCRFIQEVTSNFWNVSRGRRHYGYNAWSCGFMLNLYLWQLNKLLLTNCNLALQFKRSREKTSRSRLDKTVWPFYCFHTAAPLTQWIKITADLCAVNHGD